MQDEPQRSLFHRGAACIMDPASCFLPHQTLLERGCPLASTLPESPKGMSTHDLPPRERIVFSTFIPARKRLASPPDIRQASLERKWVKNCVGEYTLTGCDKTV